MKTSHAIAIAAAVAAVGIVGGIALSKRGTAASTTGTPATQAAAQAVMLARIGQPVAALPPGAAAQQGGYFADANVPAARGLPPGTLQQQLANAGVSFVTGLLSGQGDEE